MVEVIFSETFEKQFRKIKNKSIKEKIKSQIRKIIENPQAGKPLRHNLKGERTIYIKPYRLIYALTQNTTILLTFEHRDDVYE